MDSTRVLIVATVFILAAIGIRAPIPLAAVPVVLLALAGIIALMGLARFWGYPWLTGYLARRRAKPKVREIWVPKREPVSTFTGVIEMEEERPNEIADILQLPPASVRLCVVCEKDMTGRKSNARFCSNKCRKIGWKQQQGMG